jgi:hypothetical protein
MAFENHTTWKSSVEADLDFESGIITLRAQRGGTALPTAGETPERLRTSGIIPKVADSFPDNTTLLCRHVECNQIAPLLIEWLADYEWTTPQPADPVGGDDGVPARWRVSMQSVKSQKSIDRDINGFPIITVTREPYDPPVTDEFSDLAYLFTTEQRPFNPTVLQMYIDAVSSDVFMGHQPGACKVDDITAEDSIDSEGERTMNVKVRVVVARMAPIRNLVELYDADPTSSSSDIRWRAATGSGWRYSWRKTVLAEGYFIQGAASGAADVAPADRRRARDEFDQDVVKPVMHSALPSAGFEYAGIGRELKKPEEAQFYTWQTKRELPLQTLFQSI